MTNVIQQLTSNIEGEVQTYSSNLNAYAHDESIFTMDPKIIIDPKNVNDVMAVVQIASENNISITARGGGTGVAGQSIGSGIILDFSKHMNRVLSVSDHQAIVEPGVVLGVLNTELSKTKNEIWSGPWKLGSMYHRWNDCQQRRRSACTSVWIHT
jgi:FAD/FMN-containing dehydrogenase